MCAFSCEAMTMSIRAGYRSICRPSVKQICFGIIAVLTLWWVYSTITTPSAVAQTFSDTGSKGEEDFQAVKPLPPQADSKLDSKGPGIPPPPVGKKYVIIGCNLPQDTIGGDTGYIFHLPFTTLTWQRIGFDVVILLFEDTTSKSRSQTEVNRNDVELVLTKLNKLGARVHIFHSPKDYTVLMSQVSRLYVVDLVQNFFNDDDYLLISDADIWPVDPEAYHMSPDVDIVVYNAFCCGGFSFKMLDNPDSPTYTMYPYSSIGAKTQIWRARTE